MDRLRCSLIMVILCASGGSIFNLPYLFEVFYKPLQQATALSNTQLGSLMGVFGAVSMLAYSPGGWLADRVSPRKLITLGMVASGLSGLVAACLIIRMHNANGVRPGNCRMTTCTQGKKP